MGLTDLPKPEDNLPTAIVVIGSAYPMHHIYPHSMAGAGKTTFITKLYAEIHKSGKRLYSINLDPAANSVPFPANIDIRKTVNYKNVMEQYGLGPNGAILTCLNLYATKFDQVLNLIEKRSAQLDYILIDTPGQIEVFNWSASGSIILDTLAISMPTVVVFIVDTFRCQKPITLISNMMYACSVMYKSKVPFLTAFSKSDLADPIGPMKWATDPREFAEAISSDEESYMSTLAKTCSFALSSLRSMCQMVPIGARTSPLDPSPMGYDELLASIDKLAQDEYFDIYLEWIRSQREKLTEQRKRALDGNYEDFLNDKEVEMEDGA